MNSYTQADLGNAMATAEEIDDHDLRKQMEAQVYLVAAFVNALDDLAKAIKVATDR